MCSQWDSSSPRATVIVLIRLDGYQDSSESSLGVQTILLVLSFTVLYQGRSYVHAKTHLRTHLDQNMGRFCQYFDGLLTY